MTQCIDSDAAVALASVAEDPMSLVEHVASCDVCRARIGDAALLRSELGAEHPVRDGFVGAVMASLPPAEAPVREPPVTAASAAASLAWTAVHGLLGAGLGLVVAMSGSAVAPGGASPLLAVGLASAAALTLPRIVDRVNAV